MRAKWGLSIACSLFENKGRTLKQSRIPIPTLLLFSGQAMAAFGMLTPRYINYLGSLIHIVPLPSDVLTNDVNGSGSSFPRSPYDVSSLGILFTA